MKLSELVHLRNRLEKALDLSIISSELEKNQLNLYNAIKEAPHEYYDIVSSIANRHTKVLAQLQLDIDEIQSIIGHINNNIHILSRKFFTDEYRGALRDTNLEATRNIRRLPIPDIVDIKLANRINLYSSWKYPALEIGCRDGEWTKHLVSSDPLYVADVFPELLVSTSMKFTPAYQTRLRKYQIVNNRINGLPVGQIGFIFSFNFFNYLSLADIKDFLIEAFNWLRPGGTMLFTYNNADMGMGAAYAENYFMSYVPKSYLVPLCTELGFTISAAQEFEPAIAWIEIQKPGTLTTIKAHQALGEIKRIMN